MFQMIRYFCYNSYMKKILLLLIIPFLLACQQKRTTQEEMITRTQALMGTFVTLTLSSSHQAHISESFKKIKEIENSLSSYDTNASIYRLNQKHSIAYDRYVAEALQLSQQYYKDTQGYFDITIGSISKDLYHFGEENATLATQKLLDKATLNIHGLHITKQSISTQKDITIDLGGMGKGYGVDKIAKYLKEQNINQDTIAFSGDIRCFDKCDIYLQSPLSENMFAHILTQIPNVSISTSGTYRRYIKNKEAHHLIDPKQRKPQKNFISVSLFSLGDNTRLDAYATAVSVMPLDTALDFLKKYKDISFILVKHDGNILYSDEVKLLHIRWLPYKEMATIHTSNESKKAYTSKEKTLTHPNISNPEEIKR